MQFSYRAKQDSKTQAAGLIEAGDLSSAIQELRRKGLFPLEVVPLGPQNESGQGAAGLARPLSRMELGLWARTLGQGLAAGLSLTQALHLVSIQEKDRTLGNICRLLEERVTGGASLAAAMEQLGVAFPPVAIHLAQAGEAGGALEEVLAAFADQTEAEAELISKVQGALWYPGFVLAGGFVTVAVLLWVVVPKLGLLFSETGQTLPWLTRFMIASGKMLVWAALLAVLGIGIFLWAAARQAWGRKWKDGVQELLGRLPVLGALVHQAGVARLSDTLGLLIGHGLSLPAALRLSAATVGSRRLREQIQYSQQQVIEGIPLSQALLRAGMQEPFLLTMISMGEAQGDLSLAFRQAGERYHREVDKTVRVLSSLIEPVLILLVGLMVGAIVVSMVLPIFQINFSVE